MLCEAVALVLVAVLGGCEGKKLPHLAFILIDDMGYNDFSWQSTDLKDAWPNVNKLVTEGVRIGEYYTQPLCSPTRGAFLTGRHPVRLGLQHGVLQMFQDWGIPENETTIADKLRSVGYRTYGVGKWHVGYYSWNVAPTGRGFDHYYGYMNGAEDYYTHKLGGYLDLLDDKQADWATQGNYSSIIFQAQVERRLREHKAQHSDTPFFLYYPMQTVHSPLEALPEYTSQSCCSSIPNADRKTYCGMARAADDAIGKTMDLFKELFPNDDIVVFIAGDNGGMPAAAGNNWPLRGHKAELWEGGVRNNALVWSNTLIPAGRKGAVWNKMMHVMDVHATLRDLAGAQDKEGFATDGVSQWEAIIGDTASKRTEFLVNIDPVTGEQAYRMDKWKLLLNVRNDTWYPVPTSNAQLVTVRDEATNPCLFDISADPTETTNLYSQYPEVVREMTAKLQSWSAKARVLVDGWDSADQAGMQQARKYYSLYPWKA